jgi:peptidoglycan/LPS O-acetylase OafA/YrhL
MSHTKFLGLDGMRGVAALFVVLRHTGGYWGPFPFPRSYLAVDVFFVLSGFVIAHAYERRFEDGSMTTSRFLVTRLIRLYPMYFFGLTLGLLWALSAMARGADVFSVAQGQLPRVLLLSLVFLPSHLDPSLFLFPLNGPAWSLFYELVVNGVYSVVRRWLTWPVLVGLLGTLALLIGVVSYQVGGLDLGITAGPKVMLGASARAFFGMGYGLLMYHGYRRGLRVPSAIASALGPIVLMSMVFMTPMFGRLNWLVDVVAVTVVLPGCVMWSASSPTPLRLTGLFTMLGVISYPLYVLHWPLSELGAVVLADPIARYRPVSGVVFTLTLLLLCATVVRWADESIRARLTARLLAYRARG